MLTTPWALLALSAVPLVVGIYLFRTRTRRRDVSSLFLWSDQTQAQQGGRRIENLQFPLLLLLELLILALLAVAASDPNLKTEWAGRPTAIILDNSYSMTTEIRESNSSASDKTKQTVQELAVKDLKRFFREEAGYPIQFILAGSSASLLASRAKNAAEAERVLNDWKCNEPTAAIESAIALAARTAISGAKILVVTDHAPAAELPPGKLRWFAYGEPVPNLAIVHASRTQRENKDRILVEVANQSLEPAQLQMVLLDAKNNKTLRRIDQPIQANEVLSLKLTLDQETKSDRISISEQNQKAEQTSNTEQKQPSGEPALTPSGPVEIRLADDSLMLDNRYTLLPPTRRPVRVFVSGVPTVLRFPLEKAITASGIAELVESRPDLICSGSSDSVDTESGTGPRPGDSDNTAPWTVRFLMESNESKVQSYVGPFIVDRSSPLTTGLSLEGVVWSASPDAPMGGLPIISAGNVPLFTEQIFRNGSKEFRIQIQEKLSTLSISPSWPILIWNILKNRSDRLYGIPSNNLRLGSEAVFIAAPGDSHLEIRSPDGQTRSVAVHGGRCMIPADQCGLFSVKTTSGEYLFSSGTLSAEESDLRHEKSGFYGSWLDEETIRTDYRSFAWILLLLTLALLTIHWIVAAWTFRAKSDS